MNILPCHAASGFQLLPKFIFALGLLGSAVAREKKLDEFDSLSKLKPGTTGLLQGPAKGMKYFLKVPRKYDARNGARLIVFLHGSNMNGWDYLNLWEGKPDVLQKQRQIPIAVIHGKADPVVQFSQGEHAYDCFRAMGWTKLRLFAPEKLNHMFGIAPIDEALEWLETVNGRNEKKGLNLAKKWAKDGECGWVRHAVEMDLGEKVAQPTAIRGTLEG